MVTYRRVRSVPGRRTVTACLAVLVAATTALSGGPHAVMRASEKPPPPRSLAAGSPVWSGGWATTTGNRVTDVAAAIGSAKSGLDGTGVGIALIDTGVAPVPGLPAARVVNGPDLSFDAQAPHLRYLDEYGHGTHLAGIMVGNDPTTGLHGIAPNAKLTSIKVGAAGGVVDVAQVIAALNWVVQHKNDDPANPIKVIALAYGTDSDADRASDPLYFAVENAYRNGLLVVVAGGNSGSLLGRVNNPASNWYVLSVGSSDTKGTVSLADDSLSTFSSTDNEGLLDIVAPGEGIVSLRVPGSGIDAAFPGARVGENLFRGSGSSQACAVVAAAAALLFQKAPTSTPWQVRAWITSSGTPLVGTNAYAAAGSLNIGKALTRSRPTGSFSDTYSSGLGSLENSRGRSHVVHNNAELRGASSITGAFNNSAWVTAVNYRRSWNGGVWMGKRLAGDGWTGTSWASKTWAGATWSGTDWAGQAWADDSWNGRYWTGRYWTTDGWSGRYWTSNTWQSTNYSAKSWATAGWY